MPLADPDGPAGSTLAAAVYAMRRARQVTRASLSALEADLDLGLPLFERGAAEDSVRLAKSVKKKVRQAKTTVAKAFRSTATRLPVCSTLDAAPYDYEPFGADPAAGA